MILNPSYLLFKTCKLLDDAAIEAKLEATTRKLQQGYQQAKNGLYTTFYNLKMLFSSMLYNFYITHMI
jgi:hypothetical protein